MNSKVRKLVIPIAISLPLLVSLLIVMFFVEREPTTSKDIIAKKKWNEEELTKAMSRTMQIHTDRDFRQEVSTYLNEQLKKFPTEKQSQIRIAAATDAMNKSLEQLRLLQSDERQRIMKKMNEQSQKAYERVAKMSEKEKDKLRHRQSSDETKAIATEANKIFIGKMTPEERRDFYPIVENWLKTMRQL